LAGIGIRSSLQAGLSSQFDPETMWNSVTTGLLQGVATVSFNYATQQLNINLLLANAGFAALSSLLEATFITGGANDKRTVLERAYDTFEKRTLTFLGYGDPISMATGS
jgi:hypothetical protein